MPVVDVRRTLQGINPRKAAGTDNIRGRVLRECAQELTMVLTDIFNISLSGFGPLFSQCPKTQLRKPWITIAWWLSPQLSWSGWNGCFWPHSGVSWHQCVSTAACIQEEPVCVCHPLCSHVSACSFWTLILYFWCWTSWQAGHPPPSNLKPALHKGVYGGLYCIYFSCDYSAKYLWSLHTGKRWQPHMGHKFSQYYEGSWQWLFFMRRLK